MASKKRNRRSKVIPNREGVDESTVEQIKVDGSASDVGTATPLKALHPSVNLSNTDLTKGPEKIKSRFANLSARILKLGGRFLTITLAIVIFTVLFSDIFQKNIVVIEPFMLNSTLQSKGYDGQMVANQLAHNIAVMIQDARSVKEAQGFIVPLSTKLPDVEVPETKTSVKTIIRYIQEFPPFRYVRRILGLNPIRVEGEASLLGEQMKINLRISKDVNGSNPVEPKTFTKNLEGKIEGIDSLFDDVSQYILEDNEPYLWAAYLYRNKKTEAAKAKIQYCIYLDGTEHADFAFLLWGLILMDEKKYDEAIIKFEEATKHEKSGENQRVISAAYNNWGLALLYQHKIDDAIAKFEEAIRRDPNYALAYNNYGMALLYKKEIKKAIEKLDKALKLDPHLAIAYYNLGYAYWEENPDRAASLFMTSIKLDPTYADAYNGLGLLQATVLAPCCYDEAIANLKEATARDKESASAQANLGLAWMNKSMSLPAAEAAAARDEAIKALRKAIELYESQKEAKRGDQKFKEAYSKAYNDLGWAYEESKDYKSAVTNYEESFKINPAYYYAITGKGDALRKAGEFDAALTAYESVLQQPEADKDSRYVAYKGKGLVFFERCSSCPPAKKRKELEQAISMFEEAQKIKKSEEVDKKLAEATLSLQTLLQKAK